MRPVNVRRLVRRTGVVAVLAAAAVLLRLTVFRPEPVPVTVFRVAEGRVEETVTNSKAGTVRTRQRASLSPEIAGRVAALPVREGDEVRAGQVLLRLADEDYRAQVDLRARSRDAAEASQREACTSADLAASEYLRQQRLAGDGIVSEQMLDQARNARDTSQAGCEGARARVLEAAAALEAARVTLGRTVLRAPFDGVVAEVRTEVGEWITPSPPGVMIPAVIDVLDNVAIYVSAPLDEVDVARVRVGLPVRLTLDAYPGRSFPGRVTRVAPYVVDVEEQNRTFEIEARFDDDAFARTLLPGTSADVEVVLESKDRALRIPSYALMEGNRVLVLGDDGVLHARDVATGLANWEFVEIARGLEAGERVVVSLDRADVKDGAPARVEAETEK